MAFDTDRLTEVAQGIRDMLPVKVVIGGKKLDGAKTSLGSDKALAIVGEFAEIAYAVRLIVEEMRKKGLTINAAGHIMLGTARQKSITVDGNTYRISGTDTDSARITTLVACGDVNS